MTLRKIGCFASLVGALAFAAPAVAGGGNGNGAGPSKSSSSIDLVVLDSSTGTASATVAPHWGQVVTFDVSTAADRPYVTLNCYQDGAWVYTMTAGAWPEAPGSHYFTLSSSAWTAGAADCSADLHYTASNGKKISLATRDFHVDA
jgi:hypothetical protein